ncbi:MAG: hypothetical protein H6741_29180 [Alphaproteobacteria bacterium]|nr:hypothetical protein [Alphaproteobacteria bacterium]MCB9796793.1 hypothetical protein [Alphaproteobacteria bacterium]
MLLLTLLACELVEPFLHEVREAPTEVSITGYLYNGPFPDADDIVITGEEAVVRALDPEDGVSLLFEGQELYPETYPGYWGLVLEPEQPYLLRIDGGPGHYPALWSGVAPPGDGLFPSEAAVGDSLRTGIFGWPQDFVDAFFAQLAESEGVEIQDLALGEVCHLWGGPADPEAVRGDRITVEGGDGQPATVFAYTVDEETGGLVRTSDGPVYYFLAFNLAPGEVLVRFDGDAAATTLYPAEGGDLIAPWYFLGSP